MTGPRWIALIGMMGVGKTSVGRIVAENLGCSFADLDDLVSQDDPDQRHCARILEDFGEGIFRSLEYRSLSRWVEGLAQDVSVISLGGGAVTHPGVRDLLQAESAWVVWLAAPPAVIVQRLLKDPGDRPLLESSTSPEDLLVRVAQLYAEREGFYGANASALFSVSSRTPEEIAKEIAERFPKGSL